MSADPAVTPDLTSAPPPAGFEPLPRMGGFVQTVGPLLQRLHDGVYQLGFRVEPRHTNTMGICHGGMLATFCDMLLPLLAHHHPEVGRRFVPTINLQLDYLSTVGLGAWVQGQGEVLRATRSVVFVQGLVTADGKPAVRASGIFKLGPALPG